MGKIWLTLLIVFRIVLTAVGAESVYHDEQSNFACNTLQPGCTNVCYNAFAPLSHIRFWVFQVIMITTPTIMYLGFAMHKIARMDDVDYRPKGRKRIPFVSQGANWDSIILEIEPEKEKEVSEKPRKRHDGRRHIKRDGLMKVYVFQLLSRAILEVSFLFGQYFLFGLEVAWCYECTLPPCNHKIDCFVSRSTEKTIFLRIMYAISSLCLLLTVLEILHLSISSIRDSFCAPRSQPPTPRHTALSSHRSPTCHQPSARPGYHTALKRRRDEVSSRGPERLRRHLKLIQQHLDLAYQTEYNSSSRSSSPESNGTAVKLNGLNFAQEKQSKPYDKGLRV